MWMLLLRSAVLRENRKKLLLMYDMSVFVYVFIHACEHMPFARDVLDRFAATSVDFSN